jgi:hypothetical protein
MLQKIQDIAPQRHPMHQWFLVIAIWDIKSMTEANVHDEKDQFCAVVE